MIPAFTGSKRGGCYLISSVSGHQAYKINGTRAKSETKKVKIRFIDIGFNG
jgi:hypothetical protein